MDLMTKMVEHHVWLVGEIVERAATLPEEQPRRADRGVGRGRRRRSHAALAPLAARRPDGHVERGDREPRIRLRRRARREHRVDPRAAGERPDRRSLAHAREVIGANRLDETFVDAVCEPPEVFTYGGMIAHVLTFAAHRRTLAIGALHSAGDHRPRCRRPDALGRRTGRIASIHGRGIARWSSGSRSSEGGRRVTGHGGNREGNQ